LYAEDTAFQNQLAPSTDTSQFSGSPDFLKMDDMLEHLPPLDAETTPKPKCSISPNRHTTKAKERKLPIRDQTTGKIRKTRHVPGKSLQTRKGYNKAPTSEDLVIMRVLCEQMSKAGYTDNEMAGTLSRYMSEP